MPILLTGAFGNLGTACVSELLRQGHTVRCFDLPAGHNKKVAREFANQIEIHWGDIRDLAAGERAVRDCDTVIHLAAIIPPRTNEIPELARAVNVGGTQNILCACEQQPHPPRLLFASSLDVFGHTRVKPPPRRVNDPVSATDLYSEHKIECEKLVRASRLEWLIFRFADVPILGLRDAHPIMFEIGLDNRGNSFGRCCAGRGQCTQASPSVVPHSPDRRWQGVPAHLSPVL